MKYRNDDLLVYIAIADAYAAAAEYVKPEAKQENLRKCLEFTAYVKHPTHHGIIPGSYTDDAEMSIANTKVLLQDQPFTRQMFADAYVNEFIFGGKREGYAGAFHDFLLTVNTGSDLLKRIKPFSTKNGAAMRAAVIGVLADPKAVMEVAATQARVTHDTPEGVFSAQAVALMSHFALHHTEPLSKVDQFCLDHLDPAFVKRFGYLFRKAWLNGPVTKYEHVTTAVATVHAVADLIRTEKSLMSIMKTLLLWGGDTDSVAAIAWGIASSRYQDEKLPEFTERDLEKAHPQTGSVYLKNLGRQLMEKYA